MRTNTVILIGALLLVSAGFAQAQQQSASSARTTQTTAPAPLAPQLGQVAFGFRATDVSGDRARYNKFRDWRNGGILDAFQLKKENETWFFRAEANNVGYRDQRYFGELRNIGRLKASFEWNQIPLFMSDSTRSLYTDTGNGVLAVDDTIQQGIQGATVTLADAIQQAKQFDLRSCRDTGSFSLVYTPSPHVDVKVNVRNTNRSGYNLMSFGFGTSPGLNPVVEMGVPVDDRTTDLKSSVELSSRKGLLILGYTGSWYDNSVPTVRFDNPLRITNISAGAAVGQVPMWPTNSSFSFNVNGSYKLPQSTRASAAISIGRWSQDEPLVPPTVNTALIAPAQPRASADARADIVSMVYGLNSRPVKGVWLNAKYRYYDYNNKTAHFETTALIGDWALGTAHMENEPPSLKRHTLDLGASFAPEALRHIAFNVGYTREDVSRTFRIFEETAENILRVSADSTGFQYFSLRASYERSSREGSGFDEHLLEEVSEHPEMRHYDIADRDRDRVTAMFQVTPVTQLGFNVSVGHGTDDYKDSYFGLRDNEHTVYGVGMDVVPLDTVTFNVSYGKETYEALQWSRTALPAGNAGGPTQFFDPTRDWSIDQTDKVTTVSASLDLLKALPKTEIRFGYDLSDGKATYVYGLTANQTIYLPGAATQLTQLAPLESKLTVGRADVQYFLRPNVAIGVAYWYEKYQVYDFTLNPTTVNQLNLPSSIYSGYLYQPYTANSVWVRMTYLW